MAWKRWTLRTLFGVGLGIAIGSGPGCKYNNANVFVADFADELCRIERVCDAGLKIQRLDGAESVEVELPNDASCEGVVETAYARCDDDCDRFNEAAARRCMRRIKRRECGDAIPVVCDRVFTGCEGGSCSAPTRCSVDATTPGRGGPLALVLLGLGLLARRRRSAGEASRA